MGVPEMRCHHCGRTEGIMAHASQGDERRAFCHNNERSCYNDRRGKYFDDGQSADEMVSVMAIAISNSCATSKPILYINDEGGPGIDLRQLARAVRGMVDGRTDGPHTK